MLQRVTTWCVERSKADEKQSLYSQHWFIQNAVILSYQFEFHYNMYNCHQLQYVRRHSISFECVPCLCWFKKKITPQKGRPPSINDPHAWPTRECSAFPLSNINSLLTTQQWCCALDWLRCKIWHKVITKDPAYVCSTNDTLPPPSLPCFLSLYSELLWPIFTKARYLCLMHCSKEKRYCKVIPDDILPTTMAPNLATVNVCCLLKSLWGMTTL